MWFTQRNPAGLRSARVQWVLFVLVAGLQADRATANQPPVLSALNDAKSQLWNTGFTVIDNNGAVTDPDSADFNTGALIVRVTNGLATDRLSIRNSTAANQINLVGTDVRLGTTSIGTLITPIPVTGSNILRVRLKATATPAVTTRLIRAITYRNQSATQVTGNRTVQFKVLDGDGGTSIAVNKLIRVGTLAGNYTGSFTGTVQVSGVSSPIPGPLVPAGQNNIAATIAGNTVTVQLPGLGGNGTGTVAANGEFSAASTGTVGTVGITVQFTGSVALNAAGNASGSGTWTIVNSGPITGSGNWTITR